MDDFYAIHKNTFTTALLGASIFSFQSTAWADTLEQQFQQGSEATTRGDYQTTFKFCYLWRSREMQRLN